MAGAVERRSIVQYLKSHGRESCGYCKTGTGFKRFGLWAFDLTVEDYQSLIDRGWRRSGHYCYKPILSKSCCPMYTIRCDTGEFRLSRSQRRVLKAMNAYLHGDVKRSRGFQNTAREMPSMTLDQPPVKPDDDEIGSLLRNEGTSSSISDKSELVLQSEAEKPVSPKRRTQTKKDNPEKAKSKRIKRKSEKLKALGLTDDDIQRKMLEKKRYPIVKTVEDFINDHNKPKSAHKLEVRLVRSSPRSKEFDESYQAEFELFKKYQISIHNDPPEKASSFDNFLVDSPLYDSPGYGSFHQQYWLDDKLIAVGVVDILPNCLSSVYLFYDPDYSFLSLGTYSALREVHYIRSLRQSQPNLIYYYMGFYIHSCKKMRYKAAIKPSFLLCPEVLTWHSFVTSRPKIEANAVARLNEDPNAQDEDGAEPSLNDVMVIYKRKICFAGTLTFLPQDIENLMIEFVSSVGRQTSRRMILQV